MVIDINDYLRINLVDVLMVCISTAILIMVAKHFFWDIVLRYFDERKAHIESQFLSAKEAIDKGNTYKEQYHEQVIGAKEEASQILKHSKQHALLEKNEIIENAKSQARMIKESAKADSEKERRQSELAMKETICDVAFASASKIIDAELSDEQKALYSEQIEEQLKDAPWKES